MTDPLVSVIIPAYNAQRFLRKTLESVQRQTYRNLEVIIVDDGSTDRTAAIAQEFCKQDSRFKLLSQQNRGVAAARNLAIRESSGEFVAPLDADDIWYPEKIEKQVKALLSAGDNVGLVYTWTLVIDESDQVIGATGSRVDGYAFLESIHFSVSAVSSGLFRRRCLEIVGCYQSLFRCEDWELEVRFCRRYEVVCLPEYLFGYRRVGGSMSHDFVNMHRGGVAVLELISRAYPEVPPEIFRWKRSRIDFAWSLELLQIGSVFRGCVLLFRALSHDWLLLLLMLRAFSHFRRHPLRIGSFSYSHGLPNEDQMTEKRYIQYHQQHLSSPSLFSKRDYIRFQRVKSLFIGVN
jgi:glycosyltransferase involved in cell wall biosynthesis